EYAQATRGYAKSLPSVAGIRTGTIEAITDKRIVIDASVTRRAATIQLSRAIRAVVLAVVPEVPFTVIHPRRYARNDATLVRLLHVIAGIHAIAIQVVERDLSLALAAATTSDLRASRAILKVDVRNPNVGGIPRRKSKRSATRVLEDGTICSRVLTTAICTYGRLGDTRTNGIAAVEPITAAEQDPLATAELGTQCGSQIRLLENSGP